MRRLTRCTSALLFGVVLVVTSCGGSSGGGPGGGLPPTTTLDGTYAMVSLSAAYETATSGDPVVSAGYGTAVSDGRGTLTADTQSTRTATGDPVLEPPGGAAPVPLTYEEDEDGNVALILDRAGTPQTIARGTVSTDGALALFATVPPFPPGLTLLVRRDPGYTTDSFTGAHQFVAWWTPSNGTSNYTWSGEAVLSAPDELLLTFEEENKEGEARAGPGAYPGDWEPYGDGRFEMSFDNGTHTLPYDGGCGGAGAIKALGGCLHPARGPTLWVLLRRAAGLTRASFSGAYRIVGLQHDSADNEYRSILGRLSTAGDGLFQFSGNANTEGTNGLLAPVGGMYTVASNGYLTLPLLGSGTHAGALSASGDFAILAGSIVPGGSPGIFLLLRR